MALTRPAALFRTIIGALAIAVCALPSVARASSVVHVPLERLTRIAGVAFAGTVDSMNTTTLSGEVVTLVRFSQLAFAKGGRVGSTLTLAMDGGRIGGKIYGTVGQPSFEIGRRYVVLCDRDLGSPSNLYSPIIGLYQGFYPILRESENGPPVVHDWKRRPVAAISGGHIVSVEKQRVRTTPRASSPDQMNGREPSIEIRAANEDPGTRVREAEFLDALRRFALRK